MEALLNARNPAIWLSFGKDSLLVLKLALEQRFTGPCYYFGEKLSNFAQQAIIDHSLTVYSWPATNRYVVPDGQEWAQVDEYLVGGQLIPMLSPVTRGENCDHMQFTRRFTKTLKYSHDITLTGYKYADENEAIGVKFPREFDLGFTRIVNPLYDWSDERVINALGFTPPEGAIEYCNKCLTQLETIDRDAALASFRGRFNFY